MTDYISREAAKRLACQLYCAVTDTCDDDSECAIAASFDALPAADVRENKQGEYVFPQSKDALVCSLCGAYRPPYVCGANYCPNCGACMEEQT